MQKKYIPILFLFFTAQINSFFSSSPEAQVARRLCNKHVGILPSIFNSKQMVALLQDIKKESSTRSLPEASVIREMRYLIEERCNYWQEISNDSKKYYDEGIPLLAAAACIVTLTCIYTLYVKKNYTHYQTQVKLLSATAPQELESIEHELKSLGARWIDLKKDLPEPSESYLPFTILRPSVSAWGSPHKSAEISELLKKAKLVHDNLNSARWNLKNTDCTAGAVYGCYMAAFPIIQGTCDLFHAYYAKFYYQKYYFIKQELQKYQTSCF